MLLKMEVNYISFIPQSIVIVILLNTVGPPIKDTLNKEHLSIKDKSTRPNSYYTIHFNL